MDHVNFLGHFELKFLHLCVYEREREKEKNTHIYTCQMIEGPRGTYQCHRSLQGKIRVCVCACTRIYTRGPEREKKTERARECVCICVCEKYSHIYICRSLLSCMNVNTHLHTCIVR